MVNALGDRRIARCIQQSADSRQTLLHLLNEVAMKILLHQNPKPETLSPTLGVLYAWLYD